MPLGRQVAGGFFTVLGTFVKPVIVQMFRFYYRADDHRKPLGPVRSNLLLQPAHVLAKKIRTKEVTARQLVEAFIDRIEQVNPLINAVVYKCYEDALREADQIDGILSLDKIPAEYSEEAKPLLGVPFSCKECFWVKDMPCATGNMSRREYRSPEDAEVVWRMREAGAILTCLTNTPELCLWMESRNPLYGVTRNPYNLSRIVGGSSGGEGAIIASAGAVIGIGSDIGGSIRIPMCMCGVYGHKTTIDLINPQTQYPPVIGEHKTKMLTAGPICRYASDLRLLIKVQAGPERFAQYKKNFETPVDLKTLKYYVIEDYRDLIYASRMSSASHTAVTKTVAAVESKLEVKCQRLSLDGFKYAFEIWEAMLNNGEEHPRVINNILQELHGQDTYSPVRELVKQIFGQSKYSLALVIYTLFEKVPKPTPQEYLQMREVLKKEIGIILGDNSIIIAPSFPFVAPYHNQPVLTNTFDFIYFGIWNALQLPVTQVPVGLCAETGLPTGVQIVSNEYCDHLTISLAEFLEENNAAGWVPGF